MPGLSQEIDEVQNPGLGALAVWRFATGYASASQENKPTPLPLLFLVVPLLYHEETFEILASMRPKSGLRGFAGKFSDSEHRKTDILLQLQERCLRMRQLSLDALRIALATKLLVMDPERAVVFPLTKTSPKAGIPGSIRAMLQNAEKVGAWCSDLSLHEVSIVLRVRF